MTIKTPGNYIQDRTVAANGVTAPNNNIMVAGQRGILGATPISTDLVPLFGYPKISLYVPYPLPSFGSGNAALEWLQSCGFTVGYGLTTPTNLPIPTTAIVAVDGVTWTLTFTGIPTSIQPMIGITLTGTATQDTSTGSIESVTVNDNGNAQMVVIVANDTITFDNTEIVNVVYTNLDISTPDETQTERVCMQLYALFEELNLVRPQLANPVTEFPQVYLTLYAATDTTYSENTATINLTTPAAVSVVTATGAVLLGWTSPTQPTGWGYLPDTAVGNIVVTFTPTVGTPATGVLFEKGSGDPEGLGWAYYMVLTNVVGTFTAATAYTVVKDGSQNLGVMTDTTVAKYYLGFHDASVANASLTIQFKNIIDQKNNYYTVAANNGVGAFGFLANSSLIKSAANTLTPYNDRYLVMTYFPVPSQPLLANQTNAITSMEASAFVLACMAMNAKPYRPTNNIVSSVLTAPTSSLYRLKKSAVGDSEVVLKQGYTPLYIDKFNRVATVRVVTSQLTLPGFTTIDTEFFPASTQQILMAFNQDVISDLDTPQFQNQRKTDDVKNSIFAAVFSRAMTYQTAGMFANVLASKSLFTVVDNPDQVDSWIVNIPAQITPELNNLFSNVNVYSFAISFQG